MGRICAGERGRCLVLFWALMAIAGSAGAVEMDEPEEPFIAGRVPGETGFPGAASVLEEGQDGEFGFVIVEVPYRDVRGEEKMGRAMIVVRRQELESARPVPLFCHVHYPKDIGGAKKWCKRGWAVVTGVYDNEAGCPIEVSVGDSNNLARAIIQWARRLPFADRQRLHIDGGSQGGYMALAMGAEFLPVTSVTADAPVVNWAYNLAYFEANRAAARAGEVHPFESPLPVVALVTELASERMVSSPVLGCYGVFGPDLAAEAWYRVSPISYLDRISCPVLIQIATGDMLVPHEQMTDRFPQDFETAGLPEGYQRDFETLAPSEKTRRTFEEAAGEDAIHWELLSKPDDIFEFTLESIIGQEKAGPSGHANIDRPWSPDYVWNVAVFDEGPPRPWSAHTRYKWNSSPDNFVAVHQEEMPGPGILNAEKLDRLMQRYEGHLEALPALKDGVPANRLNFPDLEQLDVVTGLLDYARFGAAHRQRLARLYREGTRKPFGEQLGLTALEERRGALLERLELTAGAPGPAGE